MKNQVNHGEEATHEEGEYKLSIGQKIKMVLLFPFALCGGLFLLFCFPKAYRDK